METFHALYYNFDDITETYFFEIADKERSSFIKCPCWIHTINSRWKSLIKSDLGGSQNLDSLSIDRILKNYKIYTDKLNQGIPMTKILIQFRKTIF